MDSADVEVLRESVRWLQEGRRVLLATVIETWGSSPRPVGALAAIRDDGLLLGSVSGGCVEDDLILRNKTNRPALPQRVTYGVTSEEARRFGLPCGGTLELLLEPAPDVNVLRDVLQVIERRGLIAREIHLPSGRMRVVPPTPDAALRVEGDTITITHGPRWRLIIIGAAQSSRYLAEMATALDYQVTVCDPRAEYAGVWDVPGTILDRRMPDDAVVAMRPDRQTAIITLSHDPKLDDMALLEALKTEAFYVGALGSKVTNKARRERLATFDLTDAQIARLRGPVGLPIGSRTPAEIAVAILAELTGLRNGVTLSRETAPAPTDQDSSKTARRQAARS
jgi:xanthine dehydrogenase accessory factor